MIFNTSKDLYMLDVFGRDVDSYPIKIDNSTNLSHSLFDYNNTKKYRVLIPTNKQIINNLLVISLL